MMLTRTDKILICAEMAHEANRLYCQAIGDPTQQHWADAPDWQKASATVGVENVLRGSNPEAQHEAWMDHKQKDGWVYGEVKDPERKTHPCMVPYAQLPPDQKRKDSLYIRVVEAMAIALDLQ